MIVMSFLGPSALLCKIWQRPEKIYVHETYFCPIIKPKIEFPDLHIPKLSNDMKIAGHKILWGQILYRSLDPSKWTPSIEKTSTH